MLARLSSAPCPAGPTRGAAHLPRTTCPEAPVARRLSAATCPVAHLALAVALALAPAPALAAPPPASERDLAYERAVQAEEAGDHVAAAAHYERAFRLTTPAETGPRLLFLRSGVAARTRAFDGSSDARAHLCPARALLRDYLGATADLPARPGDPTLAERDSLTKIEQQLAGSRVDCTADPAVAPKPADPAPVEPTDPPPATKPDPPPPADPPTTKPVGPEPLPPARPPLTRKLRISGGAALGAGAAGFAMMTAGIVLAADARKDGFALCRMSQEACDNYTPKGIRRRGDAANAMIATGATIGAIGIVTGIILFAVSKRAARPRVAVTPTLTGLTLSTRF